MPFVKGQAPGPGRPKGARNKKDVVAEQLTQQAISEGLMPLDFFLSVMRCPDAALSMRHEAAKAAAPYVHRKMPIAIENGDAPFKVLDMSTLQGLSIEELEVMRELMRKAHEADLKSKEKPLDPRVTTKPGK